MNNQRGEGLWALVPVKPFSLAKQRLSSVLSPSQRAGLARAMLHDVLDALVHVDELAGVLVVTSDPDAVELARAYGALVRHDAYDAGTNCAVRQGLCALQEQRRGGVVVAPGDAPFLTVGEIASALACLRTSAIVLAPAWRDGGVNLLAASLPLPIEPCFGTNSFARHLEAARAAGVEPAVLRLRGIGFDIDRAEDLAECSDAGPATRTGALLASFSKSANPPAFHVIASPC